MNFTKSVRTPVFAEHHQRLLLIIVVSTVVNGELANETANYRSSHQRCSINKGVLRDFKKFTGKHLCQSLFFDKVAGLAQVFYCEFCEISKKTFFTKHLRTTDSKFIIQKLKHMYQFEPEV